MTTWTQGEYMHFEILVEDVSGKTTLEILVPKIINPEQHTFNIHAYKGIGHIPKNLISWHMGEVSRRSISRWLSKVV